MGLENIITAVRNRLGLADTNEELQEIKRREKRKTALLKIHTQCNTTLL